MEFKTTEQMREEKRALEALEEEQLAKLEVALQAETLAELKELRIELWGDRTVEDMAVSVYGLEWDEETGDWVTWPQRTMAREAAERSPSDD